MILLKKYSNIYPFIVSEESIRIVRLLSFPFHGTSCFGYTLVHAVLPFFRFDPAWGSYDS